MQGCYHFITLKGFKGCVVECSALNIVLLKLLAFSGQLSICSCVGQWP